MNIDEIARYTWFSCALACSKYIGCENKNAQLSEFKIIKGKNSFEARTLIFPTYKYCDYKVCKPSKWDKTIREVSVTNELLMAIKLNFGPHNGDSRQNDDIAKFMLELTK